MSWASSELVSLLIFLLPGLVAAALFSSLTSRPKPSDFDRVFKSLIFTILIQAITAGILWCFGRKDPLNFLENGHVELLLSVGIAIVLGVAASYVLNHDWVFRVLRFIRVTKETSLSPWYSSFFNNDGSYVILHPSSYIWMVNGVSMVGLMNGRAYPGRIISRYPKLNGWGRVRGFLLKAPALFLCRRLKSEW